MVKINICVIDDQYPKFQALLKGHFDLITEQRKLDFTFNFVYCKELEPGKKEIKDNKSLDLIILDLLFKSKDGDVKSFELLKFIKENHPHLPVLLFSAAASTADLQKAGFHEEYHPDGYVDKNESINKQPPDYQIIYNKVIDLLKRFGRINTESGILITHGTDTMAWAFAILRYGLFNLKTNVVLTGSQLPLEGAFSPSDAIGNMLTSVQLLNMLVPPNIIQVFNDGIHIFNKNLVKVKKWSVDAFHGNSFGRIETEDLKIEEDEVYQVAEDKRTVLEKLFFIKTGGTIDSVKSETGLSSYDVNYTIEYLKNLKTSYFKEFATIPINPKDSSYFNPRDWTKMLEAVKNTGLSDIDTRFDWNILTVILSPFQTNRLYDLFAEELIKHYSGVIILGYGAGNINIIGSDKSAQTTKYAEDFEANFGSSELSKQKEYSLVSFLEKIETYNKGGNDYKFIVVNSQVPIDQYDIDYEAGRIPLFYGALPSGDLSYPEAQTKLAFIIGHKQLIQAEAKKHKLTYEQIVKSCFLCGIRFNKKSNMKEFLRISENESGCRVVIHPKNVFVKGSFENGLSQIIGLLKK